MRTLLETHADSLLTPHGTPNCMAPGQDVFCNRELRFDRVNVLGFDYDYTLASYRLELQDFIYAKARDHLVERLHYPPALAERSYDREFPIRGLVFDRRHGVLLKLSYHHAVSPDTAFLGRKRLREHELRALYGEAMHVPPEHVSSHMIVLNDLFSLAEACLLANPNPNPNPDPNPNPNPDPNPNPNPNPTEVVEGMLGSSIGQNMTAAEREQAHLC